jgi:hypothetical protein
MGKRLYSYYPKSMEINLHLAFENQQLASSLV